MKRVVRSFSIFLVLVTLLLPLKGTLLRVGAVTDAQTRIAGAVVFFLDSPVASVHNRMTQIDETSSAVRPVAIAGRTLLPVRFLAESLGAGVQWLDAEKIAVITSADCTIRIPLDRKSMTVNGQEVPLDVPARVTDGRILVPMRAIAEALGRKVDWHTGGLIVVSRQERLLDPEADAAAIAQLKERFSAPITYRKTDIPTANGTRSVHVTTIRPEDPRVRFEVMLPGNMLNQTADFTAAVKAKGATVAVNANFFTAYGEIKDPIGHVMIDGRLVYGQSGLTTVGIATDKTVYFERPAIFTRLFADGKKTNEMANGIMTAYNQWPAYEVNTRTQSASNAIVYTPHRGKEITFTAAGDVVTVKDGKVVSVQGVSNGSVLPIPADGFLAFYGTSVSGDWADIWRPEAGRSVELENYLFMDTETPFPLKDMQWMIAGGPDLVINGKTAPPSTSATFSDARFTTSTTPRTAIGMTAQGKLLLVSTAAAKIQDMKEIMIALGCVAAINLDGGGSTGLYYDGSTIMTPGRQLATMLLVYDGP